MFSDSENPRSLAHRARARRFRLLVERLDFHGIHSANVLDLGGTLGYWRQHAALVPAGLIRRVEVVNLPHQPTTEERLHDLDIIAYTGDALKPATLRRSSYDLVYSNSVIEHVGNLRAQQQMARVVQNLGTHYFLQTPAKSFPLEPHFYVPFFAYLPLSVRTHLYCRANLGFMGRGSDWLSSRMVCEETRLMSKREVKALFSDADIIPERFFGLTKSYIATNLRLDVATSSVESSGPGSDLREDAPAVTEEALR